MGLDAVDWNKPNPKMEIYSQNVRTHTSKIMSQIFETDSTTKENIKDRRIERLELVNAKVFLRVFDAPEFNLRCFNVSIITINICENVVAHNMLVCPGRKGSNKLVSCIETNITYHNVLEHPIKKS